MTPTEPTEPTEAARPPTEPTEPIGPPLRGERIPRRHWMYFFGALAILIGGMAIGANTEESPNKATGSSDDISIGSTADDGCNKEVAEWIDYATGQNNLSFALEQVALEYGQQSPKFQFILDQTVKFKGRALQVGRQTANAEAISAIITFCSGMRNGFDQNNPSLLQECREGNEVYLC